MQCPKCGGELVSRHEGCHRCGLVYDLWEAKQAKLSEAAGAAGATSERVDRPRIVTSMGIGAAGTDPPPGRPPSTGDPDSWTRHGCRLAAVLLLGGFIWPLLKHSLLAGRSTWLWPWTVLSQGESLETALATATLSSGEHVTTWAVLPLLFGIAALALLQLRATKLRAGAMLGVGAVFLLIQFLGLYKEAELFGLSAIPPTVGGGVITFVGLIAMVSVASTNHLRKSRPTHKGLRILSGVGGCFLVLPFGISLLGARSVWTCWAVRLLCLSLILYGAIGVRNALKTTLSPETLSHVSLLARGILGFAPLAFLIAQLTTDDPFATYVIGGGGGFMNVLMSIIKSGAIYVGGALLMAYGAAASLGLSLRPVAPTIQIEWERERKQA